MKPGKAKAGTSKLVNVGCPDLTAKATGIRETHVISHDDEEVGFLFRRHNGLILVRRALPVR